MIGYLCEIISTLKNKKSYTITNMVMYYTTIRGAKSGNTKKWGSEDFREYGMQKEIIITKSGSIESVW